MDRHPFQGLTLSSILRDMSIVGRRQMQNRRSNGFIIKLEGTTEYRAGAQVWQLTAGDILFVAKGSSYSIREIAPGYSYVINFEMNASYTAAIAKLPLPQGIDLTAQAQKIYKSWQKEQVYSTLAYLYELLEKTTGQHYLSPGDKSLLDPVMQHLTQHLTDPELDLSVLPKLAAVSDSYLRRVFKKQHGIAPASFVIRERLRLARQLLLTEKLSVSEISSQIGYRDPMYFSRLFKKQTGLSPTQYRKEHIDELF